MTLKFDRFLSGLSADIEDTFEENFTDIAEKLDKKVKTIQKRFFKKLVIKAIDRKSAPSLGEFSPKWVPLSKKYLESKSKLGQSSGFFMKTGQLKSFLQATDPKTILGTPITIFTPSGFRGRSGVKYRDEVWRGRGSKRRVLRDAQGRFASLSDLPRFVKASLRVDPYPKILENTAQKVLNESDYFPEDVAQKLKNPKGRRLRPVFTNFLNWFLETEIRKAVNSVVR